MALMRFVFHGDHRPASEAAQQAYLAGMEGIPWRSRNVLAGDTLIIDRPVEDSGCLHIPWPIAGEGEMTLSTATLVQRDRPYILPLELARGTLNRIRNQLANWQAAGLAPSESVGKQLKQAMTLFAQAATSQADPAACCRTAEQTLALSVKLIHGLAGEYAAQVLASRHRQAEKLPTLFGVQLGPHLIGENLGNDLCEAFNSAIVPMTWNHIEQEAGARDWTIPDKQIDWCRRRAIKTVSGPLIQLEAHSIPQWLYLFEDDFDHIQSYFMQHVEQVVQRYRGKISIWQVAARINSESSLELSEEQRLRLTVQATDSVRRIDPRTPVIISFDQPWAEYMARESYELSPLHFADALVRADLGIAGIGLEMNLGYFPRGTQARDSLEISRQLDRWSTLGLPLLALVTAPSGSEADPQARLACTSIAGQSSPLSLESQRDWAEETIPLLLSKHSVHGIIWNQLSDSHPHDFPHGGLYNGAGVRKPVFNVLASVRQEHLI